jgi:hypothetical protein
MKMVLCTLCRFCTSRHIRIIKTESTPWCTLNKLMYCVPPVHPVHPGHHIHTFSKIHQSAHSAIKCTLCTLCTQCTLCSSEPWILDGASKYSTFKCTSVHPVHPVHPAHFTAILFRKCIRVHTLHICALCAPPLFFLVHQSA